MADIHAECASSAHPCFPCKMKLWRQQGAFALRVPDGWKGPSVRFRAAEMVREAKELGNEIEYVGRAVLR